MRPGQTVTALLLACLTACASGLGPALPALPSVQGGATLAVASRLEVSAVPAYATAQIKSGLQVPDGVAVDRSGNVYIADTKANAVDKLSSSGALDVIGAGFRGPEGVAVDHAGNVYVADSLHNAIKIVSPHGGIRSIGSGFSHPEGVAVGLAGDVFVADTGHNEVKKVSRSGKTAVLPGSYSRPAGIAVDTSGTVYVADTGNNEIKELRGTATTVISSSLSSPAGVAVDSRRHVYATDTGNSQIVDVSLGIPIGTAYRFPRGVAVDSRGRLYVADTGEEAIKEEIPIGTISTIGHGFELPFGITLGRDGVVYVSDELLHNIYRIAPGGGVAAPYAGFTDPRALAYGPSGPLYAVDQYDQVVDIFTQPGRGHTLKAHFPFPAPSGIATDSAGNLFVCGYTPYGHGSIVEVTVSGKEANLSDGGVPFPLSIVVDASGNIFVGGSTDVTRVEPSGSASHLGSGFGNVTGVAVTPSDTIFASDQDNGQVKSIATNGIIMELGSGLKAPEALAYDSETRQLYIADGGLGEVEKLSLSSSFETILQGKDL